MGTRQEGDASPSRELQASVPPKMGESCSSTAPATPAGQYLTVDFDDGPESGLLVQVMEDDFCDPRFWCFEEVHQRRPVAKVLFPDGVALYVGEWPHAAEGTLIDEDGDSHGYLREENQPQSTAVARLSRQGAVARCAPIVQRRGLGGWGHVDIVAEPLEDDAEQSDPADHVKAPLPQVGKQNSRRRRVLEDEDYVEKKRPRVPPRRHSNATDAAAGARSKPKPKITKDESESDKEETQIVAAHFEPSEETSVALQPFQVDIKGSKPEELCVVSTALQPFQVDSRCVQPEETSVGGNVELPIASSSNDSSRTSMDIDVDGGRELAASLT